MSANLIKESTLYTINPVEKLVYVTPSENIDLDSCMATMQALVADEEVEDFGILVDLRLTKLLPSAEESRWIALTMAQPHFCLHHPIAFLVSQEIQYGMAHMISIVAGLQGAVVRPFYEFDEAKSWLKAHLR